MTRALVLLNPNAGRGRAEQIFAGIANRSAHGPEIHTVLSTEPAEALARANTELRDGSYDRVIAVGGDGSGNLAVQALMDSGAAAKTAFGLVPAGTGSDFVRCLDPRRLHSKSHSVDRLERLLRTTETRPCDITEVLTASGMRRYSLNVASAGLSSAVNERINRAGQHGNSSYLLLTVRALIGYKPYYCRIEADGEPVFDGPIFLAAIANGRFFGKGMQVAPEARIDDGRLDLIIVPPIPKWKLPWRLPRFIQGRHLQYEEVISCRAESVRFEPAPGLPSYDLDGDSYPAESVTFRALGKKLRLLC